MKTITTVTLIIFGIALFAQKYNSNDFKLVKIESQTWMAENLDVDQFSNGEYIYYAKTKEDWIKAKRNRMPAFCYYKFNEKYRNDFGKLYNWFAVNDKRGLAPEGFRVPTREEYLVMIDTLGGDVVGGIKLKSKTGWKSMGAFWRNRNRVHDNGVNYHSGNGTNESGFNGKPGPFVSGLDGKFQSEKYGHFWTTTKCKRTKWDDDYRQPDKAYLFDLKHHDGGCGEGSAHWGRFFLGNGLAVRCIKNSN